MFCFCCFPSFLCIIFCYLPLLKFEASLDERKSAMEPRDPLGLILILAWLHHNVAHLASQEQQVRAVKKKQRYF